MKSTSNIYLNLQMPNYNVVAYAVQGDVMSREITAILHDGQTPFTPPSGALGTIRYMKPDGTSGFYDTLEDEETVAVTWDGNVCTIRLAEQILTVAGDVIVQLSFYNADAERLSTFNFRLFVEKNPLSDEEFESTDYYSVLTARIAAVLGAVAHAPQINELGHWVLWDEEDQEYYDSGVDATGPQGETGPRGYAVGSVSKKSGTGAAGTTDVYAMKLNDTSQTEIGTFDVYNGSDGQGSPGSATPLMDGTASTGTANAYSREDHVHPSDTSKISTSDLASNAPQMDGTAAVGTSTKVAREDHVHPSDSSKQDVSISGDGYCKMADGTLICWKRIEVPNHAVTTEWGNMYESNSEISLGDWPIAFYEAPRAWGHVHNMSGFLERFAGLSATSAGGTYITRPNASTGTFVLHIFGIGRWKA